MNRTEWMAAQEHPSKIPPYCTNHKPYQGERGNVRFVQVLMEDEYMICPECKTIYEYWLPDKMNENKTS